MLDITHTPPRITLPDKTFFEMVKIPCGSFIMGSKDKDAFGSEKYLQEVTFDYPFLMGKYPVTQALWVAVMDAENPSVFKGMNRPVESVSWYDAAVFCNRLSELCKLPPVYFSDKHYIKPYGKEGDKYILHNDGYVFIDLRAKGFRLPNEAEWEYAAKGISSTEKTLESDARQYLKYAGANKLDDVGWYGANSHKETKPVGLKLPNLLGLHDMSGNVWEWCNDHWHVSYEGVSDDGFAWIDKSGGNRVLRGGSWIIDPRLCRVSSRGYYNAAIRFSFGGFRLVLVPIPVQ